MKQKLSLLEATGQVCAKASFVAAGPARTASGGGWDSL